MSRHAVLSTLAFALFAAMSTANATESALHNDMDGDGRSDLVWFNPASGAIVYWSGASSAAKVGVQVKSSTPGYTYDPGAWTPNFMLSDLWFDPLRTMPLVRSKSSNRQMGLFPSGDYFWASPDSMAFDGAVAHGDFNGNGMADILYRDPKTGSNIVELDAMLHDWGATFRSTPTVGPAWIVAGTGDFDGDGRSDILWRNTGTGSNVIWRSGVATTRIAIGAVTNLAWKIAAIGDFNGDGRSDILWRNATDGRNVLWKSGNRMTRQTVASVTDQHWQVVATGDFDGDGRWDLVWRNSATGANTLWKRADRGSRVVLAGAALRWRAMM